MKHLKFILIVFLASACKKEDALPRLSFSESQRSWFIYQVGQQFKFKNPTGDSITFTVETVSDSFRIEHKGSPSDDVAVANVENYIAYLSGVDDFINIAFYKSSLFPSDADKLNQTIAWHKVTGQFVEFDNIKNQTPFISKIINGITYNKVTAATPMSNTNDPWTRWKNAYYDQEHGFIELIDTSGVSWLRQ
jgi:hypothetical protein